jgi:hypothetical protein
LVIAPSASALSRGYLSIGRLAVQIKTEGPHRAVTTLEPPKKLE